MGFFLTIVYLLIVMIRPQEFYEAIKGWPILDFMAVISLGTVFFEGRVTDGHITRSATSLFVLLFLAWCGLSHVRMGNFGLIVDSWLAFARTAIVYYLVVMTVDTLPRLKRFTWVMVLLTTFLAVQAVIQFYTGSGMGGAEALVRGEVLQAKGIGIFDDPNDLGLQIVTWVPFLLPMVHRPLLSGTIWTGLLILVPVITSVAFTRSRGSVMGLAAVFWFYFYKRVGAVTSIIALVVLMAALMAIPRMDSIGTSESSARSRMELWSEGLEMFKYRPITGVGFGQFTEHHSQTAHNSFVLVFAELGLVGAFLWICIFFSAVRDIYFVYRDPRPPPDILRYCDGLLGSLLGWHVCAFFLSHSYKFLGYLLVALAVAVLNSLENMGIHVDNPWTGTQTKQAVYMTVAAMALFYIMLRTLWNI